MFSNEYDCKYIQILSFTVRNSGSNREIRSSLMEDSSSDLENEKFRFGNINGLTNVTVQVGTIAYMHCPVVNLGERTVSTHNIFLLIYDHINRGVSKDILKIVKAHIAFKYAYLLKIFSKGILDICQVLRFYKKGLLPKCQY